MKIKLIAAFAAVLALFVVTGGTAIAAPNKNVAYSYPYVSLTDRDGHSETYAVSGGVEYNKNGTVTTYCSYGKYPYEGAPIPTVSPYGSYVVVGASPAVPDTSSATIKQYCIDHFNDRVYPYP